MRNSKSNRHCRRSSVAASVSSIAVPQISLISISRLRQRQLQCPLLSPAAFASATREFCFCRCRCRQEFDVSLVGFWLRFRFRCTSTSCNCTFLDNNIMTTSVWWVVYNLQPSSYSSSASTLDCLESSSSSIIIRITKNNGHGPSLDTTNCRSNLGHCRGN